MGLSLFVGVEKIADLEPVTFYTRYPRKLKKKIKNLGKWPTPYTMERKSKHLKIFKHKK